MLIILRVWDSTVPPPSIAFVVSWKHPASGCRLSHIFYFLLFSRPPNGWATFKDRLAHWTKFF